MPNTKPIHDGQIHIAVGSSRTAAKWKNQTMSWSDFLQKISVTTLTRETVEEYKKLPKTQQDAIKAEERCPRQHQGCGRFRGRLAEAGPAEGGKSGAPEPHYPGR